MVDQYLHGFDLKAHPAPQFKGGKLASAFLASHFINRHAIPSTAGHRDERRSIFFASKVAAFFQVLLHCGNVCGYSPAEKWWNTIAKSGLEIQGPVLKQIVLFLQVARVAGRLKPEFKDGWTVASQSADLWLQFLTDNKEIGDLTPGNLDHLSDTASKFISRLKAARGMETAGRVIPISIQPAYKAFHEDPELLNRFLIQENIAGDLTASVASDSLQSTPSIGMKRLASPLAENPVAKRARKNEDIVLDAKSDEEVGPSFFVDLSPHRSSEASVEPEHFPVMASISDSKVMVTDMEKYDGNGGRGSLDGYESYSSLRVSLSPTAEHFYGRIAPVCVSPIMTNKQAKAAKKERNKGMLMSYVETIMEDISVVVDGMATEENLLTLNNDMSERLGKIEADVAEIKEGLATLAATQRDED